MTLNVIRYEHAGDARWGLLREDRVLPVPGEFHSTGDFVRTVEPPALRRLTGDTLALADLKLLAPVTRDQQFICQGANYRAHMLEAGMDPEAKTFNMIFTKATSAIVPADHDVILPRGVRFLDYEIELGLVLRRDLTARTVVPERALAEYVAGIVIVNDYSARDVQIPQMQFYKGKSFRSFGPVGPYLCLIEPEDVPLLAELTLRLTVNGEVRQEDNTRNMAFGPAETLSELSGVHDLYAGDLIATGTPAGCALSVPSPAIQRVGALLPERLKWKGFFAAQERQRDRYLKPGDVVEARITGARGGVDLGVQRNRVVAEQTA